MMFISKFNRLIRSKTVWFFIAAVIVISFVFFGMDTGGIRQAEQQDSAGKLDGTNISNRDYQNAYAHVYFEALLRFGDQFRMHDAMEKALQRMAWQRIAALKQAEQLKLSASDEEIAEAIRNDPLFTEDGRFVPERYQSFARHFLPQLGFSEQFYDEHVREEVILRKLRFAIAQAVWISPAEVETMFSRFYDTFEFSHAVVTTNHFEAPVTVTDEKAMAFLEENPKRFIIPEKASVKYVGFSASGYLSDIEVDETEIQEYYHANSEQYAVTDDDGFTTMTPLEEVSSEIRSFLAERRALNMAADDANEFEIKITPDRYGQAPSFDEVAEQLGLSVSTTMPFAIYELIPGIDANTEFNKEAFELRNNPNEYFSRPIRGESNVYVIAFNARYDSRVPEFEEVRERVVETVTRTAIAEALWEKAADFRNSIRAAIEEGQSFQEAAESLDLEVVKTKPFSLSSDIEEDSDEFYALLENIITLNPGELTQIIPSENGMLIGYLKSRTSAEPTTFESIRNEMVGYMKRRRATTAFTEWEEYLLSEKRFEPALTHTASSLPEDDDEDW